MSDNKSLSPVGIQTILTVDPDVGIIGCIGICKGIIWMSQRTIGSVNAMCYEEFITVFGNVIEHCSMCTAAVWRKRPFADVNDLHTAICNFVDQLPIMGKEGLLRLIPDLAGRLAHLGALSAESTREHRSAGLDSLTEEERKKISTLNQQYKRKFGFPFVICARENKKEAILNGLERRLANSMEIEAVTGVEEVKKICRLRLLDIVDPSSKL